MSREYFLLNKNIHLIREGTWVTGEGGGGHFHLWGLTCLNIYSIEALDKTFSLKEVFCFYYVITCVTLGETINLQVFWCLFGKMGMTIIFSKQDFLNFLSA